METNENHALTKAEGCYHCKPLVQQRDELAAQVERLRCALNQCVHVVEDTNYGWDGDCGVINKVCCIADGVLDEPPTASLAALKAQWQAEAGRDGFIRGYFHSRKFGFQFEEEIEAAANKYASHISQRAQEAGDA